MTMTRPIATPESVLAAITTLAPTIRDRAAEVEAARRIPLDLLADLKAAGAFAILRPPSHGGAGAELPSALRMYETLARADASVGWTVMIGAGNWCDLAELTRPVFDELLASPDSIGAGVFSPSGSITPVGDGYRVDGRWSFASGCEHADWLYGNCIESVHDGIPQMRIAVFTPDDVVIEDTWDVAGMRGTGSHHFHVDGVVVPAARTLVPMSGDPCIDAPIIRCPIPSLFAMSIASVALGIASGALDDIVDLAAGKVPLLAPAPLATNPRFQYELAVADTDVRAARSLIHEVAALAWSTAVAGDPPTIEQLGAMRSAATWAVDRAVSTVGAAYRAAGGTAPYADCPLQRRLRDITTLKQHFLVNDDALTSAGAILVGQDITVPVF